MDALQKLKDLIASCEDDYQKAKGGNKAAGTRVRKIMQDVKSAAQEIREEILSGRTPEGQGSSQG